MTFASTPGAEGPRDLLAAATPRPWRLYAPRPSVHSMLPLGGFVADCKQEPNTYPPDGVPEVANAALIVAAVNEYEALLDIAVTLNDVGQWIASNVGTKITETDYHVIVGDVEAKLGRLNAVRSGA